MSSRPPVVSKVGRTWYSTWPRSGSLLALIAVYNLSYSAGPEPTLTTLTWMLGWLLFQSATDLSMPGTQDQKVRFTGPLLLPPLVPPEEVLEPPHAANGPRTRRARTSKANRAGRLRVHWNVEKYCIRYALLWATKQNAWERKPLALYLEV